MKTDACASERATQRAGMSRKSWVSPTVADLPRLTDLTLSSDPIDGVVNPGGGTPTTLF